MTKEELLTKLKFLADSEEKELPENKYYADDFTIKRREPNLNPKTEWGWMNGKYAYARDEIGDDQERKHVIADELLLEFINDKEIKSAFDSISKWYA